MSARQTPESFWARVGVGSLDECWPWTGSTNNFGYGTVAWHGQLYVAHRVAAWLVGLVEFPEAPADWGGAGFVLHSCDNPPCCNPTHFDLGTFSKNQLDSYLRERRAQPRGEAHANARMSDAMVEMLRADAGHTRQVEWAAAFGVSQVAVSLALRRVTYTHL